MISESRALVVTSTLEVEASSTPSPALGTPAQLIRRFVTFLRQASVGERAAAVRSLSRVYFHGDISAEDRISAQAAMTLVLDDRSDIVRAALAEEIAYRLDAPRHLVLAFISQDNEIAARVVQASPLLLDSELVELLATSSTRCGSPW